MKPTATLPPTSDAHRIRHQKAIVPRSVVTEGGGEGSADAVFCDRRVYR